jgi:hypothetical protein
MYKVTILATGKIALFQGKVDAEKYVQIMKEKGHETILSKWTWLTEVEK